MSTNEHNHGNDESVHEKDVKLAKEDKVEAYNEEIKVPHEQHKHNTGLLPPWAYVLIGALGGAILLLILSYTYNGWRIPGENTDVARNVATITGGPGGRFNMRVSPNGPQDLQMRPLGARMRGTGMMNDAFFDRPLVNFDENFRRMQSEFDNMEKLHEQMMGGLNTGTPGDGFVFQSNGETVLNGKTAGRNLNGSLSFYSQGKQYSLPYSADSQKLVLKTVELKNYLDINKNAKIDVKVLDYSNNVLAEYGKTDDFAKGDLTIDLKPGQSYLLDVTVQDDKGNSLMQVRQGL